MSRGRAGAGLLLALALTGGCGACGGGGPVGELRVEPRELRLDYGRFEILRLRWRPLSELDGVPFVFLHLLDEGGGLVRTFDHPFPGPWRVAAGAGGAGEVVDEVPLVQSVLGPPLAPGRYRLSVGLYDPDGGRWPLRVEGAEVDEAEYAVAVVEVPPEIEAAVRLRFSSAWLAAEEGADLQVLARRWLAGEGTIRLEELPGPVTLRLALRIPSEAESPGDLRLEEGATAPAVRVASGCGGDETLLSGAGLFAVNLPLAAEAGGACDVTLRPNFSYLAPDDGLARAVVLESAAWAPLESLETPR